VATHPEIDVSQTSYCSVPGIRKHAVVPELAVSQPPNWLSVICHPSLNIFEVLPHSRVAVGLSVRRETVGVTIDEHLSSLSYDG
jgi:hypothetical protein